MGLALLQNAEARGYTKTKKANTSCSLKALRHRLNKQTGCSSASHPTSGRATSKRSRQKLWETSPVLGVHKAILEARKKGHRFVALNTDGSIKLSISTYEADYEVIIAPTGEIQIVP